MQQRHLGPLKVSALALGCMGMTYGYGEVHDKKQMVKLISIRLWNWVLTFLTLQRLMGKIMKSF
ncbi:hypothetical protein HpNP101_09920 [Helicobacter pylori]